MPGEWDEFPLATATAPAPKSAWDEFPLAKNPDAAPDRVSQNPSFAQAALHGAVMRAGGRTPDQIQQDNTRFDAQIGQPMPDRALAATRADLPASYLPRLLTRGGAGMIGSAANLVGARGLARDATRVENAAASVDPGIGSAAASGLISMAPLLAVGGVAGAGAKLLGAGVRAADLAGTVVGGAAFGKSAATQTGTALEDANVQRRAEGLPEFTPHQILAAQTAAFAFNSFMPAAFKAGEPLTGMALGQALRQGAINAGNAGAQMSLIQGLNKVADQVIGTKQNWTADDAKDLVTAAVMGGAGSAVHGISQLPEAAQRSEQQSRGLDMARDADEALMQPVRTQAMREAEPKMNLDAAQPVKGPPPSPVRIATPDANATSPITQHVAVTPEGQLAEPPHIPAAQPFGDSNPGVISPMLMKEFGDKQPTTKQISDFVKDQPGFGYGGKAKEVAKWYRDTLWPESGQGKAPPPPQAEIPPAPKPAPPKAETAPQAKETPQTAKPKIGANMVKPKTDAQPTEYTGYDGVTRQGTIIQDLGDKVRIRNGNGDEATLPKSVAFPDKAAPSKTAAATDSAPTTAKVPDAERNYDAALEASRASTQEFLKAQKAYRAKEISDNDFLAAKAKHDASKETFDAAEDAFIKAKEVPPPAKPAHRSLIDLMKEIGKDEGGANIEHVGTGAGAEEVNEAAKKALKTVSGLGKIGKMLQPLDTGPHAEEETKPFLSRLGNAAKAMWSVVNKRSLPNLTAADRELGELANEHAGSSVGGAMIGKIRSLLTFGDNPDPEQIRRFGAMQKEDQLRGIKEQHEQRAFDALAKNVTTLVGGEHAAFENEADYQKALADPQMQKWVQKWIAEVNPVLDENYRATAAKGNAPLPQRGKLGMTVNLEALQSADEAEHNSIPAGTAAGDLRAPLKNFNPFRKMAKGDAAAGYETDPLRSIQTGIGRNYAKATRIRFVDKGIETGDFGWNDDKTFPYTLKGEPTRAIEVEMPKAEGGMETKTLYVRKSLYDEVKSTLNLDEPWKRNMLLDGMNTASTLLGAEAGGHTANMLTTLRNTGGGKTILAEIARKIPGLRTLDAVNSGSETARLLADGDPETLRRVEKLARINAFRVDNSKRGAGAATATKMAGVLNIGDAIGRVTLDRMWDEYREANKLPDTDTNRREWTNQMGQYNPQAQGRFTQMLKQSGIAPFVTATWNYHTLGLRNAISPPFQGGNAAARGKYRAIQLIGNYAVPVATAAGLNYMLFGKQPDGIDMGNVAIPTRDKDGKLVPRKDADGKYETLSLLAEAGTERPLKGTGISAIVNGEMNGHSSGRIADQWAKDITTTVADTPMGPGVRAGATMIGGLEPHMREAFGVNEAAPGKSQLAQNAIGAATHAIPGIGEGIEGYQRARARGAGIGEAIGAGARAAGTSFARDVDVRFQAPRKSEALSLLGEFAGRHAGGENSTAEEKASYLASHKLMDDLRAVDPKAKDAAEQRNSIAEAAVKAGTITQKQAILDEKKAPFTIAQNEMKIIPFADAKKVMDAATAEGKKELQPAWDAKLAGQAHYLTTDFSAEKVAPSALADFKTALEQLKNSGATPSEILKAYTSQFRAAHEKAGREVDEDALADKRERIINALK